MPEKKQILIRFYCIAGALLLFGLAVFAKLTELVFVAGDEYRDLARATTTQSFVIPSNRGNIYADDGSLLATSIPHYDIRFDALAVSDTDFEEYVPELARKLSKKLGKPASHYESSFRKAKAEKNRYLLVARGLRYADYLEVKEFPLFRKGPYKGGFIAEQRTAREHPIGKVAERIVGYERQDENGYYTRVGLEGAYGEYLRGKDGMQMKQRIAKGQWKPIYDENEVEPRDGYDVISTININMQDIAHYALLTQLEHYEADHGCVIVMETKTGEIKAMANLGRTAQDTYYEKMNYAIAEAHEPGSTFKTMAFMVALEDRVIDTSTIVDTGNGSRVFYGRTIYDTRGYGEISAARAMEVSSNIGLALLIDGNYKKNPKRFVEHLFKMNLNEPIGLPIKGEGMPMIPHPNDKRLWSRNALPSLAYGYGLRLTPLQTLTFYNAIANDGVMVKPRFIKSVKSWNRDVEVFEREVIDEQVASPETISKIRQVLKDAVERGTGKRLYSPDFPMAGKTGTAQTEYWMDDWGSNRRYISSFAGYFPADDPQYSCIVIIHKPKVGKGYYGADVSGPVFKRIAQKIYSQAYVTDTIKALNTTSEYIAADIENYYEMLQNAGEIIPDVRGMEAMDAISILENLGLKVKVEGATGPLQAGKVQAQSLQAGKTITNGREVTLKLSS